ncbi:MAG: helix-turn-helix domain-containing protein [Anaerolineae bacterium]
MRSSDASVGDLLRYWRKQRKISQMDLALDANISTRHLSFIETGRSQPSREMIERLAQTLRLSFRDQNSLMLSAGYAPQYQATPLASDAMHTVRETLQRLLAKYDPYPALVVDRQYQILLHNRGFEWLLAQLAPTHGTPEQPLNLYRIVFASLPAYCENWSMLANILLARLYDEAVLHQDEVLWELYHDCQMLAGESASANKKPDIPLISMSLTLIPEQSLHFYSIITTFGSAMDVTTQELRIESLLPADQTTRTYLERHVPSSVS